MRDNRRHHQKNKENISPCVLMFMDEGRLGKCLTEVIFNTLDRGLVTDVLDGDLNK